MARPQGRTARNPFLVAGAARETKGAAKPLQGSRAPVKQRTARNPRSCIFKPGQATLGQYGFLVDEIVSV
jgi:hypothetical protein